MILLPHVTMDLKPTLPHSLLGCLIIIIFLEHSLNLLKFRFVFIFTSASFFFLLQESQAILTAPRRSLRAVHFDQDFAETKWSFTHFQYYIIYSVPFKDKISSKIQMQVSWFISNSKIIYIVKKIFSKALSSTLCILHLWIYI